MSFVLGDRFCKVISNGSKVVTDDELVSAVNIIYKGAIIERIKFVFKMYDLNKNGQITPAEVRLMISHIPTISYHKEDTNFEFFNQNQSDINSLIEYCFAGQDSMGFSEFVKVTNEKSSDMFFVVFSLADIPIYKRFNASFLCYQFEHEQNAKSDKFRTKNTNDYSFNKRNACAIFCKIREKNKR